MRVEKLNTPIRVADRGYGYFWGLRVSGFGFRVFGFSWIQSFGFRASVFAFWGFGKCHKRRPRTESAGEGGISVPNSGLRVSGFEVWAMNHDKTTTQGEGNESGRIGTM